MDTHDSRVIGQADRILTMVQGRLLADEHPRLAA
jgi:predicted ABC-type transport system involved in lysophospholipase L1 biosynthesis ATPase subunit